MFSVLVFAAVWVACLAGSNENYSYSPALGGGSGTGWSSKGFGRITGVRVWEYSHAYIAGIQLRYGTKWDKVIGRTSTIQQSIDLHKGEAIIQVSGKYNPGNYIYQLIFQTSKGRSLFAGLSFKNSFNFYPANEEAELKLLSGRTNGYGITSIGAHWGIIDSKK